MRRFSGIFIGLLCTASPALAQTENSVLRDAMAVPPEQIFLPPYNGVAHFVDLAVQAPRGNDQAPGLAWLSRSPAAADLRPLSALAGATLHGETGAWSEQAGTEIDKLSYFAGYGSPPATVTIWGFTDQASADATFAGLAERGFTELGDMPGVVANGEPGQMNLASRDPANPWSGMLGETSVVARMGSHFLHSTIPAAFAPVLEGQPALIDSAAGKSLLAALEAQDRPLAQATFFNVANGMYMPDPTLAMGGKSPAEAEAAMKAATAETSAGVPIYFGGMMADLVEDGKSVALIALAYPDCATAEKAAASAAALWPTTDSIYPADVTVTASHVDAGGPGCAAVLIAESPESNKSNYQMAVGGIFRRDFPPIRLAP